MMRIDCGSSWALLSAAMQSLGGGSSNHTNMDVFFKEGTTTCDICVVMHRAGGDVVLSATNSGFSDANVMGEWPYAIKLDSTTYGYSGSVVIDGEVVF